MRLYQQYSTAIFSTFLRLWNLIEDLQTIWNPTFKGPTPIKVTNDNRIQNKKKWPYQKKKFQKLYLATQCANKKPVFAPVCFNWHYYEYHLVVLVPGSVNMGKNLKNLKWKIHQAQKSI